MRFKNTILYLPFFLISILLIGGCALPRPHLMPDASNPIRTLAILPAANHTNDVEAPERVRAILLEKMADRHYVIKSVQDVNQTLKDELGITLGSQLDMTTPQELGKKLGVDGVVYGDLLEFEEKITGVLNVRKVRGGFKLVDTKTGAVIWGRGQGVKSETKMTSGTAGAVADIASGVGKYQDKKEKIDVKDYAGLNNWHNLPAEAAAGQQYGLMGAFAAGLAEKTIKKATGSFLKRESEVMIDMILGNMPVGPGTGVAIASAPMPVAVPQMPEIPAPSFSVPGYMEFGKKDFTADMITTSVVKSNNEKMVFEAKLAKLGDKFRTDIDMSRIIKAKGGEMPPGFGRNVFITRPDLMLDYMIYPEKNKYIESPIKKDEYDNGEAKVERKKVGSEKIDGHPSDKYLVKVTFKNGRTEEGYIWEANDLGGFVIRAEMEHKDARTVVEMKNIKLGSPSPSLFEVPKGYVKATGMMEIFMDEKK